MPSLVGRLILTNYVAVINVCPSKLKCWFLLVLPSPLSVIFIWVFTVSFCSPCGRFISDTLVLNSVSEMISLSACVHILYRNSFLCRFYNSRMLLIFKITSYLHKVQYPAWLNPFRLHKNSRLSSEMLASNLHLTTASLGYLFLSLTSWASWIFFFFLKM